MQAETVVTVAAALAAKEAVTGVAKAVVATAAAGAVKAMAAETTAVEEMVQERAEVEAEAERPLAALEAEVRATVTEEAVLVGVVKVAARAMETVEGCGEVMAERARFRCSSRRSRTRIVSCSLGT